MAKKEKKAEKAEKVNDTPEAPAAKAAAEPSAPKAEASPIASESIVSIANRAARAAAKMKPPEPRKREPRSDADAVAGKAKAAGLLGHWNRDTRQGAPKMFGTRSTPESRGKVVKRKPLRHRFGRSQTPAE